MNRPNNRKQSKVGTASADAVLADDEKEAVRLIALAHKLGAGKPVPIAGNLQTEVGFAALSVLDPDGDAQKAHDEAELAYTKAEMLRLRSDVQAKDRIIERVRTDLVPVIERDMQIKVKRVSASQASRTFNPGKSEENFVRGFVQRIANNANGDAAGLWLTAKGLADAIVSGYRKEANRHSRCADCLRDVDKPPSSKNLRLKLIQFWISKGWLKVTILSAQKVAKM